MSAYVVSRDHIRFLVAAARSHRIVRQYGMYWYHDGKSNKLDAHDRDQASHIGQMLWDENIKSINARYPDTVGKLDNMPGPVDETFIYAHSADWPREITPVQVLKACNGYEYQACEHDGWKDSEAHAFIEALKNAAVRALPGYEEADWEMSLEVRSR